MIAGIRDYGAVFEQGTLYQRFLYSLLRFAVACAETVILCGLVIGNGPLSSKERTGMRKRRIVVACIAALMTVCLGMLAGCGPSNEEVIRTGVTQELDGLKNQDDAAMAEIVSGANMSGLSAYGLDANEFMKAYLNGFDYRIDDVTVDGDKAQVTVVLTCKSFSAYEKALQDAADQLMVDESFAELDRSAMNQKIGETVMTALAGIEPTETEPIVLDYELANNTWSPTASAERNIAGALLG